MAQENISDVLNPGSFKLTGAYELKSQQDKPESVQLEEQALAQQKHKDTQWNLRALMIAYFVILAISVVLMVLGSIECVPINSTFWEKVFWSSLTAGLGGLAGKAFS